MHIVKLHNATEQIEVLKKSFPVVFVGSGVSIWKPTGLASGMSVTKAFWDMLFENFDRSEEETSFIDSLAWEFPFEHLFEICPNQQKARNFLIDTYNSSESNPIHEALAKAFKDGRILHIITTNYDKCIESAIHGNDSAGFKVIVDEMQALEYSRDETSKLVFKVHGTAESESKSLIFTLRDEGLLPEGKRTLLEEIMSNRVCLFMGYSGLDFDLCPLISKFPEIKVIWNDVKDEPQTLNAKALLQNVEGTYICGDMRQLVTEWLGEDCSAEFGATNMTVSELRGVFSEEEISLWRIALLNSIGLPRVAIRAIENTKNVIGEQDRLRHKARALFYEGKYLRASKTFGLLALLYSRRGDSLQSSNTWFDASDSYRAGGYFYHAVKSIIWGRYVSKDYDRPKYLLKKSLLIGNLQEGLNSLRLLPVVALIRRWLRRNLKRCANLALRRGSLHDFQQTGLIAERNGIELNELVSEHTFSPRKSVDGYKHLGYYHAEVMIFVDKCLRGEIKPVSDGDKRELLLRFQKFIEYCELTGQDSNLWKLLATLKSFLEEEGEEFKELEGLRRSFKSCEYSKLMQYLQARKFGIHV